MQNTLGECFSRLGIAKKRLSEFDFSIETSQTKIQKEKRMNKMEQNIQHVWNNFKKHNLHKR